MKRINRIKYILAASFTVMLLSGCKNSDTKVLQWKEENLDIASSIQLDYAKLYKIDILQNGDGFITVNNEDYYYAVNEGAQVPEKIPDDITVLQLPVDNIYVVGTGSIDFFESINALDHVKYTSLQESEWNFDGEAITYAGKYSAPDYELLLSGGCDLVVENTMITHSPEVLSQLHDLGFKSIVDYASYEDTVEGRMEWVKLYGYLTGNIEEAEEAFETQCQLVEKCRNEAASADFENKSVGFFSITAAGTVSVRKKDDYINNMIEIAGGNNVLSELEGIDGTGSTTIQMESFYKAASDCDILIYNGTIEGEVTTIDDLISKNELLKSCKAVKNKTVYCTAGNFYQSVMSLGEITYDLHSIINGNENTDYLVRLQ